MAKEYKTFARGVDVMVDGKHVYLRIDMKAKREKSSTGKMDLTASTSGFKEVDGTEGFRLSLMGGFRN
jgi:hypothetical protein